RRYQSKTLEIPLNRFDSTISPPIACISAPLINITPPIEAHISNLPLPFTQQESCFLRAKYNPRLDKAPKPFELIKQQE
ncbi:hypothetical protein DFH28DRAFT_837140, partial [Melampsora americana]